jgi:aminoglycoside phosphotransferase (APT) family kinase protein
MRAGIMAGVDRITWLTQWSAGVVADVLNAARPGLGDHPIEISGAPQPGNPEFSVGSALVGGEFLAKFAFSEPTARRRWHEARVLRLLHGQPGLPVPEVVVASRDPAFLVTRLVRGGVPLSFGLAGGASPAQAGQIGDGLARFLARLHRPDILTRLTAAMGPMPAAGPAPLVTAELRARLVPKIRPGQRDLVRRWCGWADRVLAQTGPAVFVHADFHGFNQLWDPASLRLRLVTDLETSGTAEAEYDLRAVPSMGPGVGPLTSVVEHYARHAGTVLDLEHVMAWHLRSHLGDATWRGEAGLPMLPPVPAGGTPADCVDVLAARFEALGLRP